MHSCALLSLTGSGKHSERSGSGGNDDDCSALRPQVDGMSVRSWSGSNFEPASNNDRHHSRLPWSYPPAAQQGRRFD